MTQPGAVVTVDASVWVASVVATEAAHGVCLALVRSLLATRARLVQPTLFSVELAAALGRRFPGTHSARDVIRTLAACPALEVIPLGATLAAHATQLAANCALRGADAVYVATALHAGATLVTLDAEVVRRAGAVVPVRTPPQWLAGC
ncbi:MAG: hypothetical protein RLZ32_1724 [Gemmatimonadota bacterium]